MADACQVLEMQCILRVRQAALAGRQHIAHDIVALAVADIEHMADFVDQHGQQVQPSGGFHAGGGKAVAVGTGGEFFVPVGRGIDKPAVAGTVGGKGYIVALRVGGQVSGHVVADGKADTVQHLLIRALCQPILLGGGQNGGQVVRADDAAV